LAERKGWTIAGSYVDDDVSAWSGKRRPQYERLLADLEAGEIDGLLVYDLDRLHRSRASWRRSSTFASGWV
jgi:site-specific DNA recombinase